MARYQAPDDPRDNELRQSRKRRSRETRRDWTPWIGLFLGLLVTIFAAYIAFQLVNRFIDTIPLRQDPAEANVIVLTAPASPTPTLTPSLEEPTTIPTLTPEPTQDNASAPESVQVGFYASVSNTDGVGVTIRGGPSTDNVRLLVAQEGALVFIVDGPAEGSGFTWWQVRLDDGTDGWMAADFLVPADAPDGDG